MALPPQPEVRLLAKAAEFARLRGSSGATRTVLEVRHDVVIGQVFLLS